MGAESLLPKLDKSMCVATKQGRRPQCRALAPGTYVVHGLPRGCDSSIWGSRNSSVCLVWIWVRGFDLTLFLNILGLEGIKIHGCSL